MPLLALVGGTIALSIIPHAVVRPSRMFKLCRKQMRYNVDDSVGCDETACRSQVLRDMRITEGLALETIDRLARGALELEEGSDERRRAARLFHMPCVLSMITTLLVQRTHLMESGAGLQLLMDLSLLWTSTGVIDDSITTAPKGGEDEEEEMASASASASASTTTRVTLASLVTPLLASPVFGGGTDTDSDFALSVLRTIAHPSLRAVPQLLLMLEAHLEYEYSSKESYKYVNDPAKAMELGGFKEPLPDVAGGTDPFAKFGPVQRKALETIALISGSISASSLGERKVSPSLFRDAAAECTSQQGENGVARALLACARALVEDEQVSRVDKNEAKRGRIEAREKYSEAQNLLKKRATHDQGIVLLAEAVDVCPRHFTAAVDRAVMLRRLAKEHHIGKRAEAALVYAMRGHIRYGARVHAAPDPMKTDGEEEHSHPLLSEIMSKSILALCAGTGWAKALESLRRTHATGVAFYDEDGGGFLDPCRFRFLGRDYDYRRTMPGMTAADPVHAWLIPLNHWMIKHDMLGAAQLDPENWKRMNDPRPTHATLERHKQLIDQSLVEAKAKRPVEHATRHFILPILLDREREIVLRHVASAAALHMCDEYEGIDPRYEASCFTRDILATVPLRSLMQHRDLNNRTAMMDYCESHGDLGPTRSKFDVKALDFKDDPRYDPCCRHPQDEPWEFTFGYEASALRCCHPPDAEDVESWWDPLYLDVAGWAEREPFVIRPGDGEERGDGPGQRPHYMLQGSEL